MSAGRFLRLIVPFVLSVPFASRPVAAAEVTSEKIAIGGDSMQRYFLIRPDTERASRGESKLLLVMPGGSGSADFHPFVKNMARVALGGEFLVAQLVSPSWADDQKIIWPTEKSGTPGMEFTTEEFLEAVIRDVRSRQEIDVSQIYSLSWSSGGPAAYAASLRSDEIAGAFIAMSVFKPERLPDLSGAAGHRYYLFHSKEDSVCPYPMAEHAAKALAEHGADVKLETYEGGHGWHGDIFGSIKEGIKWLTKK